MIEEVWCNKCKRNVVPQKKFNTIAFAFMGAIFYLPYYHFIKRKICPIYRAHDFSLERVQNGGRHPYKISGGDIGNDEEQ
jgi:hypothetical protein